MRIGFPCYTFQATNGREDLITLEFPKIWRNWLPIADFSLSAELAARVASGS
jgi:hypothetical protein